MALKVHTIVCGILLLLVLAVLVQSKRSKKGVGGNALPHDKFVVAGYLPEYRFYIDVSEASSHLTDLILFSIAPEHDGSLQYFISEDNLRAARKAKHDNPGLRTIVSVGGGGRSKYFNSVASDGHLRQKFVNELLDLCVKWRIDGVDFDWESPMNQHQISAYIRLLHEAHAKLVPKGLLISVALHPGQTLGKEGFLSVDRVHLMTYDMSFQKGSGHHADYGNFKQAIQQILGQGQLPPEKLIVGIPAYGRHEKKLAQVKSYSEIVDEKVKEAGMVDVDVPVVEKLDPNFISRNQHNQFLFDCQLSAQRKTSYAKSMGLGGVFIWEVGQDKFEPKVSLTEAVMMVGNGTRVMTKAELASVYDPAGIGEQQYRPPLTAHDLGSAKDRRRKKREEQKRGKMHMEL
ncbi:hypothetical protein TrLO_g4854 [Triparma laevis f. longispina]|uniref:GH18 domain-containing protein n=1 Tax=Triparma laevis f. longispina TaxID=1714387 RepID=A0A9W7FQ17_9STRA|nr:hypothetical protein TrLO_g4854 [Triparma laevis f. longispina]